MIQILNEMIAKDGTFFGFIGFMALSSMSYVALKELKESSFNSTTALKNISVRVIMSIIGL